MRTHIRILAAIHFGLGLLMLLGGLFFVAMLGGAGFAIAEHDTRAGLWWGSIGGVIALIFGVLALPNLLAGFGLLARARWGRILSIILWVVKLPAFPVGTALGGYGLWVLLSDEGGREFGRPGFGITEAAVVAGSYALSDTDRRDRRRSRGVGGVFGILLVLGVVALAARQKLGSKDAAPLIESTSPVAATAPSPHAPLIEDATPAPAAEKVIYRYTSEDGAEHFVDDLSAVPARYRSQARPLR